MEDDLKYLDLMATASKRATCINLLRIAILKKVSYAKFLQGLILCEERQREEPSGNLSLRCLLTVDGEIKQLSCKWTFPCVCRT